MPLRELVRQNLNMLEKHREDSNVFRDNVTKSLSEIKVHSQYAKEKLDSHDKSISGFEKASQRQKGALAVISALGLMFIVDFLRRIFQ